ncbi:MAG: hypothetical protein WD960_07980 [Gemmatimonadota bacterium]
MKGVIIGLMLVVGAPATALGQGQSADRSRDILSVVGTHARVMLMEEFRGHPDVAVHSQGRIRFNSEIFEGSQQLRTDEPVSSYAVEAVAAMVGNAEAGVVTEHTLDCAYGTGCTLEEAPEVRAFAIFRSLDVEADERARVELELVVLPPPPYHVVVGRLDEVLLERRGDAWVITGHRIIWES